MTKLFAALLLGVLALSAQAFNEDDYPEIDIPGVAIPDPDAPDYTSVYKPEAADPCCWPSTWQGNITVGGGSSGGRRGKGGRRQCSQSYYQFFVQNQTTKVNGVVNAVQRIAGRGKGGRFCNQSTGFIMTFNADKTATIIAFNVDTSTCFNKTFNFSAMHPGCVPKNATLEGSFKLGSADSGLSVSSYKFCGKSRPHDDNRRGRGGMGFVRGRIMVSDQQCWPVAVQVQTMMRRRAGDDFDTNESSSDDDDDDVQEGKRGRGRRGGASSGSILFSGMTTTVDMTKFDPPTFCIKSIRLNEEVEIPDMPILDTLEKFATF